MPVSTLQVSDEVQQQGVEPNVITYTAVISAGRLTLQLVDAAAGTRAQCDHLQGSDQCIQPNVITYGAVISACGKFGMPEGSSQLFEEMQQQGLQPNVITYTAVIRAGCRTL